MSQKFKYLRSTLQCQALDVIKSIPKTKANYELALDRLKQRFDNKSLIIQSHISALIDTPRVAESPSSSELICFYGHVCSHVASLKTLGQPTDQWDAWLVTIITSRLDEATALDWQLSCKSTNLPKYEEIQQLIVNRFRYLETSEASLCSMTWRNKRCDSGKNRI